MSDAAKLSEDARELAGQALELSQRVQEMAVHAPTTVDPFVFGLTVFVLACFVGYYVVWKVTPALHTPLMSVTNAISGIIIVGAIIALGAGGHSESNVISQWAGFVAVVIASINIFGGFIVTQRMLAMFQKKEKKG